ncbi:MAG: HAD hydrolase family protein [Spirochaetes bacterium]|nr:HAD hydrolase family protein [Spirochaetota bacterium]
MFLIRSFLLKNKLKKIKLILLDVDGVLTDGGLYFDNKGMEYKRFNVADGSGIKMALYTGIQFAIVTGRRSKIVQNRAKELGIKKVYQGILKKVALFNRLKKDFKVSADQIAYIADDVIDLQLLRLVGVKVAVKNACKEIKKISDIMTSRKGGEGAVREFIEYLLKGNNLWEKAMKRYL